MSIVGVGTCDVLANVCSASIMFIIGSTTETYPGFHSLPILMTDEATRGHLSVPLICATFNCATSSSKRPRVGNRQHSGNSSAQ
ncbi:hypothetical protein Tco_0225471, partial [Tanacetum coccineum]